jgi:hypothetical protein
MRDILGKPDYTVDDDTPGGAGALPLVDPA